MPEPGHPAGSVRWTANVAARDLERAGGRSGEVLRRRRTEDGAYEAQCGRGRWPEVWRVQRTARRRSGRPWRARSAPKPAAPGAGLTGPEPRMAAGRRSRAVRRRAVRSEPDAARGHRGPGQERRTGRATRADEHPLGGRAATRSPRPHSIAPRMPREHLADRAARTRQRGRRELRRWQKSDRRGVPARSRRPTTRICHSPPPSGRPLAPGASTPSPPPRTASEATGGSRTAPRPSAARTVGIGETAGTFRVSIPAAAHGPGAGPGQSPAGRVAGSGAAPGTWPWPGRRLGTNGRRPSAPRWFIHPRGDLELARTREQVS